MTNNDLKYAIMIPARYQSSRFPGKPLVNICGKTMIQHVWERCCQAVDAENVFVVTDDERIEDVVINFGGKALMTSSTCKTGTDRIAEANLKLNYDFIINVQGDEPLVNPRDIEKIINTYIACPNIIVNGMTAIETEHEFFSSSVPKAVAGLSGNLLYMSRSGIPSSKSAKFSWGFKQVCIYAFSKEHLNFFYQCTDKTPLEAIEDIEILRFVEHGYKVKMVETVGGTIAVDTPADLLRVIDLLEKKK